jgi:hypothetical protein
MAAMTAWTWRYEGPDAAPLSGDGPPVEAFPSQADAETWVGETWKDLLAQGVDAVTLLRDGEKVYGPMSLRPLE